MPDGKTKLNAEAQGEVLQAFSQTFQREAHNLTPHPAMLWQQLYNRLQWVKSPIADLVAVAWEKSCKLRRKPWLWARMPFTESNSLIRTLTGHTDSVNDCAIAPDASFIVSASKDGTLRIWDLKTAETRAILNSAGNPVEPVSSVPTVASLLQQA